MPFSSPPKHNQSCTVQTHLFRKSGKVPPKGIRITVFKRTVFHFFLFFWLVSMGSILAWNSNKSTPRSTKDCKDFLQHGLVKASRQPLCAPAQQEHSSRSEWRSAPGHGCPGRQGSHTQGGGKRRKQSCRSSVVNGMNWSTRFLGNPWLPGRITWKDLQYLHIKGFDIGYTGPFKRKTCLSPIASTLTQARVQRHC